MKPLFKNSIIVILLFGTTIYIPSCMKEAEGPIPPAVLTFNVSSISETSAKVEGAVNRNGGTDVTDEGVCWNTSGYPTTANSKISAGNGPENFICSLTDLIPGTTYYARAYAINSAGTGYGSQVTFFTNQIMGPTVPTLTTTEITGITVEHAFSGGDITDDGNDAVTESGICWASNPNPTTGDFKRINTNGDRSFVSYIDSLRPSTKYYVRAYAKNGVGIAYGDELSFATLAVSPIIFNPDLTYGSVLDVDGNIYKTIKIGTQLWMAENLKTTKFNDGTSVPNVTDDTKWSNLTSPGYCWYNNDAYSNKDAYGALYNWYVVDAASNGGKNICPTGWHVASDAEWAELITSFGGVDVAGGKLKEVGTTHWLDPNTGATNETGFTALPGGLRDPHNEWLDFPFGYFGSDGTWWSATGYNAPRTGVIWLYWMDSNISNGHGDDRIPGRSVRCVKD